MVEVRTLDVVLTDYAIAALHQDMDVSTALGDVLEIHSAQVEYAYITLVEKHTNNQIFNIFYF